MAAREDQTEAIVLNLFILPRASPTRVTYPHARSLRFRGGTADEKVSDCLTLNHQRHRSAWLSGKAIVCSGDICGRPSVYDFDEGFEVVLRDKRGSEIDKQSLSYQKATFSFDGRENGDYQLAFILYTKGVPEAARVFPIRYKQDRMTGFT